MAESKEVWGRLVSKIIRQAREESRNNARIRKALEGMEVEGVEGMSGGVV